MNISEMHVWFRQFAQQMGMQNVRAILPEQIDLLINTSISVTLNQLLRDYLSATNDRVITDNSKIGQVNALRSLYKVDELNLLPYRSTLNTEIVFTSYLRLENGKANPVCFTNKFLDKHDSNSKYNKYFIDFPEYLYIADFSLSYITANKGIKQWSDRDSSTQEVVANFEDIVTNYFPVRLIDDAYLADTLNDYILKPSLRSPIIVTHDNGVFELYIDRMIPNLNESQTSIWYRFKENLVPYKLRFSYIKAPAKVKYVSDLYGGDQTKDTDCDLPEYMHVDILKHAVDLYRISISGALSSAQQQQQAQQQENTRNNYRQ